jgi:hypothetical protein
VLQALCLEKQKRCTTGTRASPPPTLVLEKIWHMALLVDVSVSPIYVSLSFTFIIYSFHLHYRFLSFSMFPFSMVRFHFISFHFLYVSMFPFNIHFLLTNYKLQSQLARDRSYTMNTKPNVTTKWETKQCNKDHLQGGKDKEDINKEEVISKVLLQGGKDKEDINKEEDINKNHNTITNFFK